MKFFAINYFGKNVWVETTEAPNWEAAEEELGRNNPQLMLSEKEVIKVVKEVIKEIPKLKRLIVL